MYRTVLEDLKRWKDKEVRKLLYIKGGVLTGKTWVMREFARLCYPESVYIDCSKTPYITYITKDDMESERIIRMLSLYHRSPIKAGGTLLIFDEVQSIPNLVDTLFRFAKENPKYHIMMSGFMLEELTKSQDWDSYQPDVVTVYPMTLKEYMSAKKKKNLIYRIQNKRIFLSAYEREDMYEILNEYLMVGGMPSAVEVWLKSKQSEKVIECHKEIIKSFCHKATKNHMFTTEDLVENVLYDLVKSLSSGEYTFHEGLRKRLIDEEQETIQLLEKNGFIYKMFRVRKGFSPLSRHIEQESYKRYLLDVGLFHTLLGELDLPKDAKNIGNSVLEEQFVYQELTVNRNIGTLFYWYDQGIKMDFLFEDDEGKETSVVPIQLMIHGNEEDTIKLFRDRFDNKMSLRITKSLLGQRDSVLSVPIYAVWNL